MVATDLEHGNLPISRSCVRALYFLELDEELLELQLLLNEALEATSFHIALIVPKVLHLVSSFVL